MKNFCEGRHRRRLFVWACIPALAMVVPATGGSAAIAKKPQRAKLRPRPLPLALGVDSQGDAEVTEVVRRGTVDVDDDNNKRATRAGTAPQGDEDGKRNIATRRGTVDVDDDNNNRATRAGAVPQGDVDETRNIATNTISNTDENLTVKPKQEREEPEREPFQVRARVTHWSSSDDEGGDDALLRRACGNTTLQFQQQHPVAGVQVYQLNVNAIEIKRWLSSDTSLYVAVTMALLDNVLAQLSNSTGLSLNSAQLGVELLSQMLLDREDGRKFI